ncbi:winged helix-turn-helix transcriptional regulator [Candidatus Woesearchaeota archaeon]|nr:winged helix-turn-helix transcriptional regulator [Candidatus Woesearchaeota archaeon]
MPDEKLAKAIHSKVRRDILHMLYKKDKISVREIAGKLKITESSASKNLKLLYYLGFIDYEIIHPQKFYFLKIKEIRDLFEIYDKIVKKMGN